jgi:hypothetical protein
MSKIFNHEGHKGSQRKTRRTPFYPLCSLVPFVVNFPVFSEQVGIYET